MEESKYSRLKDIIEWIICIVVALIITILFKYYVGTPTIVKQASMYPTLQENQRLWLNRWDRTIKKMPQKGDIITFEAPSVSFLSKEEALKNPIARYEKQPEGLINKFIYNFLEIGKKSYIKRVIGLPGDHVIIQDGKITVNNKEIEEPYLRSGIVTDQGNGFVVDVIIPENTVYALGDNRTGSTDSRCFGCIPLEKIESKVMIRIWPFNLFGKID